MANEGIMALPAGLSMPGPEQAQQTPPSVTSADSYDAAQTALGMVDPQAQGAARQAIQDAIQELDLTPEQIDLMIQMFEYISGNPAEYKNVLQVLQQQGIVDPGDFPEEFDPQFIGTVLMVLNEMRAMQAQGAMEPMQMGPAMEGMEPMAMAEGGLADVAAFLASQGRNGDTMLAHITPEEAQLLKERGGSGTINPVTGLPEFFFKKLFKAVKSVVKSVVNVVKKVLQSPVGRILGTIALATVLGPTAIGATLGTAGTAAVASGATTLLAGGSVKDALVSGALGYFGGGGTIMGANPIASVAKYLPGTAGGALNTGLATGLVGAGVGKIAGMSTQDALRMGLMSGASAAALQGLQNRQAGTTPPTAEGGAATTTDQGIGSLPASSEAVATGAPGQIGTAQDLLSSGQGLKVGSGAPTLRPSLDILPQYGSTAQDFSVAAGGTAPSTNYNLTPVGFEPQAAGIRAPMMASGPGSLSTAAGGTAPSTNYSVAPATPAAPTQPTGIIDRAIAGAKDIYNEYLSPSRPGLPADAGVFQKYGPLVAAGTAAIGAAGGFKSEPADPNPLFQRDYTGTDYMRDNPNRFTGGLDLGYTRPTEPRNPVVQTNFAGAIPIGQPGQVLPMGATMSPQGIAQPYNVSGLYGVPLIYPVNRAKGGEMTMTEFPRKTGPINGPGTGTSDSIPAMLSDGEFVFTAKAVRNAGGGSRRKGAARMYKLMKKLEGGPVKG